MLYKKIKQCRICGNSKLVEVLNLGKMALTGVFPKIEENVEEGPLVLVKCDDSKGKHCGLLQLAHNYDLSQLYGDNYGYRSGLNQSMVDHLQSIVRGIERLVSLKDGDLVIDIGSNDGTTLRSYKNQDLELVGIDPSAEKFRMFYPNHIQIIPDFFSSKLVVNRNSAQGGSASGGKKAKVITSIAMFYDLEDPTWFVKEIYDTLANDGVWVFEQSYMPRMLENTSYDTICHEHLEYYSLKQILWMFKQVGFKVVDVELNEINGASFKIIAAKKTSKLKVNTAKIKKLVQAEEEQKLDQIKTYTAFADAVSEYNQKLVEFVRSINDSGKKIFGYGASTKGNVILQACGFTIRDIPYIAEVNQYKFGKLTPGTNIPIISEEKAKSMKPDYFLVLPWHFKENIVKREASFIENGGKLVFPLPQIEVIG